MTDRILFAITFIFSLIVVVLVLVLGYKRSKDRDESYPNRQLVASALAVMTLGSAVALAILRLLSIEFVCGIFAVTIAGALFTIASDRRSGQREDPSNKSPLPNGRPEGVPEDPAV